MKMILFDKKWRKDQNYLVILENTGSLFFVDDVSEGHAVSAENAGVLVHVDRVHAQRAGDCASVLTACSTETSQNVVTSI